MPAHSLFDPARPDGLVYATYLGGFDGGGWAYGVDYDSQGATYVGGFVLSLDFPTTPGAFQTETWGFDGFIAKFSPDGTALEYATYLGGTGDEDVRSLAVDGDGAAFATGRTTSTDFPTTPDAADTSCGNGDLFVVKLSSDGAGLGYGTYLGGSGGEEGHDIAIDGAGAAYVTGFTDSSDFPVTSEAVQAEPGGGYDAFVAKIAPDGTSLDYATYLGGSTSDCEIGGQERECGIAVGRDGSAYVEGTTYSHDFPVTDGAYDEVHEGERDAFVAHISPDGSHLLYATFLGGSGDECRRGCDIGVDIYGSAFLAGSTTSDDFPVTLDAYQSAPVAGWEGFLSRLSPDGSRLVYGTYLGGSASDEVWTVAVTDAGEAFVAGETLSADFPTTSEGARTCSTCPDRPDGFIAQFGLDGSLKYGTFLGGDGDDLILASVVDGDGRLAVAGRTTSTDFPMTADVLPAGQAGLRQRIPGNPRTADRACADR